MNFLAHAVLAGDDAADRIGGLLGDFVKGPLPAGLPPALASGVALHRAIDGFADHHPAFLASRARIGARRRRVAGALVDLFYDHLLARDWGEWEDWADGGSACAGNALRARTDRTDNPRRRADISDKPSGRTAESLPAYAAGLYAALPAYLPALPAPAREVAERMRQQDWLTSYRDPEAVARAIDRMSIHRMKRANPLAGGFEEFLADPQGFAADFRAFLPDALAFAARWRSERQAQPGGHRSPSLSPLAGEGGAGMR